MDRKNSFAGFIKKGGWIAIIDALLICALLFGFAYLHHGSVTEETGARLVSCRDGVTLKLENGFEAAYAESDTGVFEFEGRFTASLAETVTNGDTTYYRSEGCEIAITKYNIATGSVQVADVYVSDIALFKTALANSAYGKGQREDPLVMARRYDAAFAITGDNYSERYGGVVMRNGVLYSDEIDRDVCVLNWDGTVDMYTQTDFDLPSVMEKGAYQIWSYGPILLEDGKPAEEMITDMIAPSRRAAFGYFEPGHYCFVIMDGEVTLEDMANTLDVLGCESGYALYGGRLAEMEFGGITISTPQEVDRACGDIIMIVK